METLSLSSEELNVLEPSLQRLSQAAHHKLTLESLFSRWQTLVRHLENEYDFSIYEYLNDVSTRQLLDEIMRGSPPSTRRRIRQAVHPWDVRFVRATRELGVSVIGEGAHGGEWWWSRFPNHAGPELARDYAEFRKEDRRLPELEWKPSGETP